MKFKEMGEAIDEAEKILEIAGSYKNRLARILKGNLRGIRPDHLKDIKKELKQFNAVSGKWKN